MENMYKVGIWRIGPWGALGQVLDVSQQSSETSSSESQNTSQSLSLIWQY